VIVARRQVTVTRSRTSVRLLGRQIEDSTQSDVHLGHPRARQPTALLNERCLVERSKMARHDHGVASEAGSTCFEKDVGGTLGSIDVCR
jgi:hypothetical protein